jgi:N-methylhydantoinase A
MKTYRIGVDIGGTFTDCVIVDSSGQVATIAKSPANKDAPALSVIDALTLAANNLGISVNELLARTADFIHGCTVATNALLERKGARAGLVTTRGFEDTIFIGRVMQKSAGLSSEELAHQSRLVKAEPPVVPHRLVRGIPERIDALGEILCPLDESETIRAVRTLVEEEGAEALAICLLWSFVRPDHERRVRDLIAGSYPSVFLAVSSEVAPVIGEYERTVSTVLTAYLGPKIAQYVQDLEEQLRGRGLAKELLMMTCRGGLSSVRDTCENALLTLDSGPVGGAIGGKLFAESYGEEKLVCADMGGTSFDVSLVLRGDLMLETVPTVDKYTFFCPKVSVRSIGTGGGSIISVDPTGIPKVGPESAGARPGPACYGLGGSKPTVADVDLILGYLNPDYFLGGRYKLDKGEAEKALNQVAQSLGMDLMELAIGAFKIANSHMADMISKLTIEAGYDPREFALLAYGGASGIHVPFLAMDLNLRNLYVPEASSVFSALGMVRGDLVHTIECSYLAAVPLSDRDRAGVTAQLQEIEERLLNRFTAEGWSARDVSFFRSLSMKYRLQVHELAIPVAGAEMTQEEALGLPERFEHLYEQTYGQGTGYRQVGIEVVKLRVDGFAVPQRPPLARTAESPVTDPSSAYKGTRDAYLPAVRRFASTPIFDGDRLRYGNTLVGPCIVERVADTIVIPSGCRGLVDAFGTLCLSFENANG